MSGNEPTKVEEHGGIVFVTPGSGGTIAAIQRVVHREIEAGKRVVIVSQEMSGTCKDDLIERVDSLFRERPEIDVSKLMLRIEKADIDPPIFRKQTAYERANPNQPFYAKLRREDKKKNRHGRKK